jgi:hypothetical protein
MESKGPRSRKLRGPFAGLGKLLKRVICVLAMDSFAMPNGHGAFGPGKGANKTDLSSSTTF